MQLINRTPFSGAVFVDIGFDAAETLVLAFKATYEFGGGEAVRLAPAQDELVFSDQYAGRPGESSLVYESDANWGRRQADVALLGYAYPARTGDRETDVLLRVGSVAKAAHVFGDRDWGGYGLSGMSSPRPFERIPLLYERAFGGTDDSPERPVDIEGEPRNPVGCGFRARRSRKGAQSIALPNVEDPEDLIKRATDRPAPVGFTFVAKGWKPRADYAGTYDAAWQRDRMPLLPKDFDPRFYSAASTGLSAQVLQGGETVLLKNLTPARKEEFVLPTLDLRASVLVDAAPKDVPLNLDVVLVDAVRMKLTLLWHGSQEIQGLVDDVRWVLVEGGLA